VIAALLAIVILACLSVFQILLIAGRPLGRFAWGGFHEVLPPKLRIASASSIAIYVGIAFVLAEAVGLTSFVDTERTISTILWVITGYFFLGIPLNAASKSPDERRVMTPVVTVLFVSCLVVALG
jgi:hypothetical protein